jgi:hypothetical protein
MGVQGIVSDQRSKPKLAVPCIVLWGFQESKCIVFFRKLLT